MKASELKAAAVAAIRDRLEPVGWRHSSGSEFRRENAPQIQASLDFNFVLSNNPASAQVTPYVQIVHAEVEKYRKLISGKSYYTANRQLRMLMGESKTYLRWVFSEGKEVQSVAELLVNDALTYAPAFYEPLQSLDSIVAMLERMPVNQQSIPGQSLAIAYCLLGEQGKAMEALSDVIAAARSRPNDSARRSSLRKYTELFGLPITL